MSELRSTTELVRDEAERYRFALVASRTNDEVTERLVAGARDALLELGVRRGNVGVVPVPGAYELPMAAGRLADDGRWDGVVCLGALIRGETYHFEVLCHAVAGAIQDVARGSSVPVTFGVLTCDDVEQALERAGGARGNKGAEAALAAAEMVCTLAAVGDTWP